MQKVSLKGHIDVPPDRLADVAAALPAHIVATHAEAGCISFEVVPCDRVSGRFLVSEVFTNQAAFDAHQTRTKASPWAEITTGIPREYKITLGDPT